MRTSDWNRQGYVTDFQPVWSVVSLHVDMHWIGTEREQPKLIHFLAI